MVKLMMLILLVLMMLLSALHFIPSLFFRPMPLGLCQAEGLPHSPNWVSSLVSSSDPHYIAPLVFSEFKTMSTTVLNAMPKVTIFSVDSAHLIAYRQTSFFNFTDWLCLSADGQITSSATMGYSDFGQNRAWVERIRQEISL